MIFRSSQELKIRNNNNDNKFILNKSEKARIKKKRAVIKKKKNLRAREMKIPLIWGLKREIIRLGVWVTLFHEK